MITLGIDQSYTSTGYVVKNNKAVIDYGVYKSTPKSDAYERAYEVALFIVSLVQQHKPDSVNIEGLAFGMTGNATRDLAGLLFTIIIAVRNCQHKTDIHVIAPTTNKKLATGSGKASKTEMIASLPDLVLDKFKEKGYKSTTGLADLADAYWLASC